ncbi:ricin-type beta-trefoil lectin domain protein [Yinghuangia sp. YIM S10712]|uniref:ricin-type beta-trefoil lectin domain protein n=1 Tax=Yinghuangia sp. YIM S10712 TaxID=3436930 RepID=UPI003F5355DB
MDAAGADHPPPPAVIAQVLPEPGELCSDQVNRHPAREVAAGRYLVNPNEWNAVGGLCVRSEGETDFHVTQSGVAPSTIVDAQRGPGAYAHITTPPTGGALPIRMDRLQNATSSWRFTTPDAGTYNAAYDLWFSSVPGQCSFTESAELMIWIDSRNKQPTGERTAVIRVGDADYTVYEAPKKSSHTLIVYSRNDPAEAVTELDLLAFATDAQRRGYVPPSSSLCSVQAGFEIWDGGVGLATESFGFSASARPPTGAVTSGLPGKCLEVPEESERPMMETCDASAAQEWSRTEPNALAHGGTCLQAAKSGALTLVACTGAPAQQWTAGPSGALVNPETGLCLDADTGEGAVRARECDGSTEQSWHPPV